MQRLIDADILRDNILHDSDYDNDTINHFLDLVDEQPEIDAEPVVHGHWNIERDIAEMQLMCNCCGYYYFEADPECKERHDYCPKCGAKMDEEKVCQTEKK